MIFFLFFKKKFIAIKKKKKVSHICEPDTAQGSWFATSILGCTATDGNFYLCLGEKKKKKNSYFKPQMTANTSAC